jgi:hypothetical protein
MPRDMLKIVTPEPAETHDPDPSHSDLYIGQSVRHPTFGIGRIVDLSHTRVIVDFPISGRKTLLLDFVQPVS